MFSSFGGMEFILNEAEIESDQLKIDVSEDESEDDSSPSLCEDDNFIDDFNEQEKNDDVSFYRKFDNREDFSYFKNQTKNPIEASQRQEENFYGEDNLPELFAPEQRKDTTFH